MTRTVSGSQANLNPGRPAVAAARAGQEESLISDHRTGMPSNSPVAKQALRGRRGHRDSDNVQVSQAAQNSAPRACRVITCNVGASDSDSARDSCRWPVSEFESLQ